MASKASNQNLEIIEHYNYEHQDVQLLEAKGRATRVVSDLQAMTRPLKSKMWKMQLVNNTRQHLEKRIGN